MRFQPNDMAFSKEQIDKIGNTIVYLLDHIVDLNKTKILKILYLLEEESIKNYGYPFFGIDFQIWKHGPVAKDIFIDLSDEKPSLLSSYIRKDESDSWLFKAVTSFNDDEFSDNDLEILASITNFAKEKTAGLLVKATHSHDALWTKCAKQYGVFEMLEKGDKNSTEYTIDFSLLLEGNANLLAYFEETKENLSFARHLKT